MCIKALDERGLDDFELADKRAACVDFDLRALMRDDADDRSPCCGAPCRVEGRTTKYYVCGKCGKPCDVCGAKVGEGAIVQRQNPGPSSPEIGGIMPKQKAEYWWCIKEDDNLMTASARSHPDVVRQDAGYGNRLPKHAKVVRIRVEEVGDDDAALTERDDLKAGLAILNGEYDALVKEHAELKARFADFVRRAREAQAIDSAIDRNIAFILIIRNLAADKGAPPRIADEAFISRWRDKMEINTDAGGTVHPSRWMLRDMLNEAGVDTELSAEKVE